MTSIDQAVKRRRSLPERLQQSDPDGLPALVASDRTSGPLSFAQEQIWLHEQRSGSGPYNLASLHDVRGPLDEIALAGALGDIVNRHDALRTRYTALDGVACNAVGPSSFVLERADVRNVAHARKQAQEWCVAVGRRPYDLENGMPFRAGLVRYADDASFLLLTFHHLAYDYASGATIFADLEDAYLARRTGSALSDCAELRYLDYAAWQRAVLTPQSLASQRRFWKERFATDPPLVVLPGYSGARDSESTVAASVTIRLAPAVVSGLRELAREEGASLFTGLLTAFRTLVQRYTELDDVSIGVPVAGRGLPEMRGVVGCFVNTLPVRTVVDANATFREALRAMRDATDAAYDAQDYPYAWIVRDASEDRPRRSGGLVQLSATMRDRHRPTLHLAGVRVEAVSIELGFAMFDCALLISDSDEGALTCRFDYREGRSSEPWMAAFGRAFEVLVESAVAEPDEACATLSLVRPRERRQLLEWASGAPGAPGAVEPQTLEHIVRAHALATPDAPAVLDGTECSYAELVRRADAVAQALRIAEVVPGMRIGVCAERSAGLIAAILGIGFARATYVPLDPALPPARLAALARDAQLRYTIASAAQAGRFIPGETLVLEKFGRTVATPPSAPGASAARADDVAYVIYTSGSTGTPKGIAIPHRALANLGYATSEALGLVASDRCLFRASIAFDASLSEIAAPLCAGATIVVAPDDRSADPRALVETVLMQRVNVLGVVPSLLAALLEEPRFAECALRIVSSGGEVLGASLVRRFFAASDAALYNLYGPSEAAGHVTIHACSREDLHSNDAVPLGRPIRNATVSVRDSSLRPVPPGAIGEIVIGGRPLALGYLGRAAETQRCFVTDPHFGGSPVYRTGDRARLRPDGMLAFLGRADAQVKVRGVRIEPGDVATALEGIDGIRQAYVVARPRSHDAEAHDLMLVAYVVAHASSAPDAVGVRRALAHLLPSSMLPAQIRFVDALPLTANGKVDAAALRALATGGPSEERSRRPGRAPESSEERRIATLWEALLGRMQLAVDDDFFAVGGDSLLAMRLIARLEESFGRRIAPASFFAEPTIAALARSVNDIAAHAQRDVERFHERGSKTPFVFLHGDFAGGRYAWRLAALLGIEQPVTVVGPGGADGRSTACEVEQMAEDLCERLMRLYPSGPLRLGGFSMAGNVALEAARRLVARGRTIEDVILVGTSAGNVRFRALERIARGAGLPAAQRRTLMRRVRRIVNYVAAFRRGDAAWRRARLRSILRLGRRPSGSPRAAWQGLDLAGFQRYVGAHDAFVPRPYPGRVFLIWPRDQVSRASDPQDDWRTLACELTIANMPGDHDAAVTTYLEEMARLVALRLA